MSSLCKKPVQKLTIEFNNIIIDGMHEHSADLENLWAEAVETGQETQIIDTVDEMQRTPFHLASQYG
jgi:hypothetical protein